MLLSIITFVLGLVIGSFLNVVIFRLETKEPIIKSRSHCPKCGSILKWYDLIPILSFFIQRGRCRYCNKMISWQYPGVEIATGLLFLAIFNLQLSISNQSSIIQFLNIIYYFIIVSLLLVIFVYDLKHYIIPDRVIYPAIIIAGIFNLQLSISSQSSIIKFSILSALGAGLFFLSLVLVSCGKWMGLGDVKLAFLMGLLLGWPNILLALFLSFFAGAAVGIGLIILGKKTIKSQIPFGPFLAGSTMLVLFCGTWLTEKFSFVLW